MAFHRERLFKGPYRALDTALKEPCIIHTGQLCMPAMLWLHTSHASYVLAYPMPAMLWLLFIPDMPAMLWLDTSLTCQLCSSLSDASCALAIYISCQLCSGLSHASYALAIIHT